MVAREGSGKETWRLSPPKTRYSGTSAGSSVGACLGLSLPMADGHQFQRPSSITVEGTSSVRTRNPLFTLYSCFNTF